MRLIPGIFGFGILLGSCGPETDAREICGCYANVAQSAVEESAALMEECNEIYERYSKKYKGTDQYEEFIAAYDKCR